MEEIITQDLLGIINRAEMTQRFYDSKESRDKLNNAKGKAAKLEDIVRDSELLKVLFDELNKLDYIVTKDGFLSKKQSSKSLMFEVISGLKNKGDRLETNLNKELSGLPLVNTDIYQLLKEDNYRVGDVLRQYYKGNIPSSIKMEDYEKRERIFVQSTCKKILSGKNYKVLDGSLENENGEVEKKYKDVEIVEAGLHQIKKSSAKENDILLKKLQIDEITEKYEVAFEYQLGIYDSEKELQSKLKPFLEKIYSFKKTIDIMHNMSDVVKDNLRDEQKYQISDKLLKETNEMVKEIEKLEEQIKKVEQEYKIKKNKESSYQAKVVSNNIKNNNPTSEEDTVIQEASLRQKSDVGGVDEELKEKNSSPSEQSEEKESEYISDKQAYEKYKQIREILDSFFEKRNQYSSEEYFEKDVVNELYMYGLGDSLYEIINNVTELRNQLLVTAEIQKIIDSVKMEYENVSDFYKVDDNGLTNIENRVIGRLLVIQTSGTISDDLRSEINYYVSRHNKLESELKWVLPNKNSYPDGVFEELVIDYKKRIYANTSLINEVNINNNHLEK